MRLKYSGLICLIFLILFFQVVEAKRTMTVDDLFGMGRVSDPQISPDGKWIAYTVTNYSMETNKSNSDIWLVSIDGQTIKQLTTSEKGDSQPRWKPDGSQIAFISSRNGTPQIYLINMRGGEANPLTNISTGASDPIWSPDGKNLAFVSEVYPDLKTDAENAAREKEGEKSPVKARLINNLLYRHWNSWREGKRQHIFIVDAASGIFRDLTPGDFDSPTIALGGTNDFNFSPDGKELAFTRNVDPMVAISTNNDIFTVPVTGGEAKKITDNPANDNNPVYSPDGKYIAYRAMARPGFEADEDDIILYERATRKKVNLTEKYDRSVGEIIFSPDSKTIYFNAEDYGREKIYSISIKTGEVKTVVDEHFSSQFQITPDGKTLVFRLQSAQLPYEIFKVAVTGQNLAQITFTNKVRLAELALQPVEDFNFKSFDGIEVHGLLVKPPFFEVGKKYPLVYLIHGGPQGAWSDDFHYRWNSQMFAAPGYVVALVNFRGSKGYGQKFCDMVSQNWGGGPYQDLMCGLDYLIATYNFIDKDKVVAAGASYGGYMINWIATQTGRFKALISHAGAFDATSKYGSTEELWFPEWEFNGTPYENPELYEKWSPSTYAKNLKKFKTPTLVIHGANDFRVPESQGFQMFTALQRNGVPSQFLYFPDEDHFIQKPQNAKLWWKTVYGWIQKWINQ